MAIESVSMRQVRPTLRAIKQLPRDSFTDPSVFDQVARLTTASAEAREQILSSLRLYRVHHQLLADASSYFDAGRLPDRHRASTAARSTKHGKQWPVYEVRSHSGAAWRGGVITDDAGDPWLAHANSHDEFHESAPRVFADPARYMPISVDYRLREFEEGEAAREREDIACLEMMIAALSDAVLLSPRKHTATVEITEGTSFGISFEVEFEVADSVESAHEEISEVSVSIEVDVSDFDLRNRMLHLYLPFLQPDGTLREQVYSADRSTMVIVVMMTQAQLAQALVTVETGDQPSPADVLEPMTQHYFEKKRLVGAYVYAEPLQALCGTWVVPSKEGEAAKNLPVCGQCEGVEPVAQRLLDLARGD